VYGRSLRTEGTGVSRTDPPCSRRSLNRRQQTQFAPSNPKTIRISAKSTRTPKSAQLDFSITPARSDVFFWYLGQAVDWDMAEHGRSGDRPYNQRSGASASARTRQA